jgi:hypothetical protein
VFTLLPNNNLGFFTQTEGFAELLKNLSLAHHRQDGSRLVPIECHFSYLTYRRGTNNDSETLLGPVCAYIMKLQYKCFNTFYVQYSAVNIKPGTSNTTPFAEGSISSSKSFIIKKKSHFKIKINW